MDNRVCALRDFDLRPAKAGPGAFKDEERHALFEREVYDVSADLMFDSEVSDLPAQQHESSAQQKDDVDSSSGSVPSEAQKEAQIENVASKEEGGAAAPVVADNTTRSRLSPEDSGR